MNITQLLQFAMTNDDFDKLQYIQLPFCYKIHKNWATNLEQCSHQIDFSVTSTRNEENRIEQFIILNGISWVLLFKMCFNSITTHLFVVNFTNQALIDKFICYCIRYTITINSHPLSAVANVTLSHYIHQDFLHTFNAIRVHTNDLP